MTATKSGSHHHANVLGVKVSAVNMQSAVDLTSDIIDDRGCGYICVTGVHGVIEAQSDPTLLATLNKAVINLPDGMPMTWVGRMQGHGAMDRVYGPSFMLEMCRVSVERGYRHFFYGGNQGVAQQLADSLAEKFPGLQIAGSYTPPFRPLSAQEEEELIAMVEESKPDIIWVGLSTPKQERFMSGYRSRMKAPIMVGVGAAFDLHTGRMQDAPEWMKRSGLQWFHRLVQEPRRLWRRYFVIVPTFLVRITHQLLAEGVK